MDAVDHFLCLDVDEAAAQWRRILQRTMPPAGKRQERFVPVEVVTALALLFVVDPSTQGFGKYDELAVRLGELVRRPAGSLVEKGRNLNGVRPNGAKGERALFGIVVAEPHEAFRLWAVTLDGARAAGIDADRLPDLLDQGSGHGFLGQDEFDFELAEFVRENPGEYDLGDGGSERAAVVMARIGQHRFARSVRDNYGQKCGFCGLDASLMPTSRMLVASHVKPWRDGTERERLDPLNGVAACPTHDAAFDTGLLTVTADGRVHRARLLRDASARDEAAHAMFTAAVRDELLVDRAHRPKSDYLDWHHEHIWRNGIGSLDATGA